MLRRLMLVALLAILATFGLGSSTASASSCTHDTYGIFGQVAYDAPYFHGIQFIHCGTRDIANVVSRAQYGTQDGLWTSGWESYKTAPALSGWHDLKFDTYEVITCPAPGLITGPRTYGEHWQYTVNFTSGTFPNTFDYWIWDPYTSLYCASH